MSTRESVGKAFQQAADVRFVVVWREPDAQTAAVSETKRLGGLRGVERPGGCVHAMCSEMSRDVSRLMAVEGEQEGRGASGGS